VGPCPRTFGNYTNVLVIQDVLTRWIEFIPIITADSETIVDKLMQFIYRYGIPQKVLTDQGSIFMSGLFDQLCSTFGVKHIDTTPYRPQANGMNERSHATLHRLFALLQREALHKTQWPKLCPLIGYIHNTTFHSTIKRSPFEALYGRLPYESPLGIPQMEQLIDSDVENWLDIRTTTLHAICNEVKNVIFDMRHTALDRANVGTKNPELLAGDQMIIRRNSAKGYPDKKWGPKFTEPIVITRKISDVILEYVNRRGETKRIHVDHVKPFHQRPPHPPVNDCPITPQSNQTAPITRPAPTPAAYPTIITVPIPGTITANYIPIRPAAPHPAMQTATPIVAPVVQTATSVVPPPAQPAVPAPAPGLLNNLRSRFGRTLRSTQRPDFRY
jgi:hypothetical protein